MVSDVSSGSDCSILFSVEVDFCSTFGDFAGVLGLGSGGGISSFEFGKSLRCCDEFDVASKLVLSPNCRLLVLVVCCELDFLSGAVSGFFETEDLELSVLVDFGKAALLEENFFSNSTLFFGMFESSLLPDCVLVFVETVFESSFTVFEEVGTERRWIVGSGTVRSARNWVGWGSFVEETRETDEVWGDALVGVIGGRCGRLEDEVEFVSTGSGGSGGSAFDGAFGCVFPNPSTAIH